VILTHIISFPSRTVPLWGTKYECVGTAMTSTTESRGAITVGWDNGAISTFYAYKLKLYNPEEDQINPNLAFIKKKIKKQLGYE